MAAVGRRLQHTVQEAEQVLMPTTASSATSPPCIPLDCNGKSGLPCSLAQAMEALQRYRSGCMAAMLELDALHQRCPSVSSASTPTDETVDPTILCSPIRSTRQTMTSEGDGAGTSLSSLTDAAQLYHRYELMKARLADTLAAQSAYMQEIELRQQLREREGVMGEYLWSARLLVEQEAAERTHLISLWAYFITSALERRTVPEARASAAAISSAAASHLPEQNVVPLHDLHDEKMRTHALLHEQQRELQQAQERAMAQLLARHDAEKAALEAHLRAALEETAQSQHRLSEVRQELLAAQSVICETKRRAGATYDGLHQQLKDTTKKMWQLQLANDHLDAKARVLERELEELRLSRSLMRGNQGDETAAASAEDGSGLVSCSPVSAVYPSNSCVGDHGDHRRSNIRDARYGQPFQSSDDASTHSVAGGGRRGGNAQSVSDGVWVAYEERSSLWESATPLKQLPLTSSLSSVRPLTAARWTREPQRRDSIPRSPIINLARPHGSSPVAVSATSTATGTGMNAIHMSEDSAVHVFAANTHRRKPTLVAGAVGDGDNGTISGNGQQPFERTMSPARHLSLDCSPVKKPSASAALSHGEPLHLMGEAAAHPAHTVAAELDHQLQSATHNDASRERRHLAEISLTASAQAEVTEPPRNATPPVHGVLEAIPAHSQISSPTECRDQYPPSLAVAHGARHMANGSGTKTETDATVNGGGDDEGLQASLLSLCSSSVSGSRARLEAARRDILRHTERLEQEVQAVTSRYDAARRQRRREKDTLRVNASVHSASNSPSTSEPRDDGGQHAGGSNAETEALHRALEELHIAQQEDDDELERYYADVNQKRLMLERCLFLVDEKLSSLS
ncbi:hypothetical protein LSCM1_05067 [Leishmania martiniquensis]|uniref:Uncharacterized protein n=1 Tax=Leishmania martiniquensis TaxID=1580590 RepID=A0A836KJ53_9TRYP|nr:hypothetical protein LSCM1_05067 [Leishmania martiniquensis]